MLRKTVVVGATVFAAAFYVFAASTASADGRIVATQSPSSTGGDNSCLGGLAHCHKPYESTSSTAVKTTTTRAPRPPRSTTTPPETDPTASETDPTTTRAPRATTTTARHFRQTTVPVSPEVAGQSIANTTTTTNTGRPDEFDTPGITMVTLIPGPKTPIVDITTTTNPSEAPLTEVRPAAAEKDDVGGGVVAAGIAGLVVVVLGLLLRLRRAV